MTTPDNDPIMNQLQPEVIAAIADLSLPAQTGAKKILELLSDTISSDTDLTTVPIAVDSGSMIEAHVPAIERLYRRASIAPEYFASKAVAATTEVVVQPEAAKQPDVVERLELTIHPKTPINMRNFLSKTYPVEKNDEVFALSSIQSAILSDVLIKMYLNASGTGQRMRARRQAATVVERLIGLRGSEQSTEGLVQASGSSSTYVHQRKSMVFKGIDKYVPLGEKLRALEIIQSGKVKLINELLDEIQESAPEIHMTEAKPDTSTPLETQEVEEEPAAEVNPNIKNYTFSDAEGGMHTMSFDTERYEVIINGKVFTSTKHNVYKNRYLILRTLIDNPNEAFSNSKLHKNGVAADASTTGARMQAIRNALNEAFAMTIPIPGKDEEIPLIEKASPRTYRLHSFFSGVKEEAKPAKTRRKITKPEAPVFDPDKPLKLSQDSIEISGIPYTLYNDEISYLREITAVKRQLGAAEITRNVKRKPEVRTEEIEDTEEALFELVKRGLITEERTEQGITYSINKDVRAFRATLLEIELDGEPLFLNEFDIQIVKFMASLKGPIQIKEIVAELVRHGHAEEQDHVRIARVIKKYFNPHQLVKRERHPKGRGHGSVFFIPDVIKPQLLEIL